MSADVAVVGVGQTKYGRRPDVSTAELLQEAVETAFADAGIGPDDVDAVFFGSAPDALLGVSAADQWLAGSMAAAGKPLMRLSTGGSTGMSAAHAAYHSVAAHRFGVVLAVAVERANEANSVQAIMNANFDPIYEKDFGLNALSTWALFETDHMLRFGTTSEHFAKVAVRNRKHALANPFAHLRKPISLDEALATPVLSWPVRLSDACPSSDGACAVVLAAESEGANRPDAVARISGVGDCTDGYFLGDRPILSRREHIEVAGDRAYSQAGISDPLGQIDVAELQNPFTVSEVMSIEGLQFCGVGDGGRFIDEGIGDYGSSIVINPSGGSLCSNPVGATSIARLAEAALQVTGRAGDRQVEGAKRALALSSGGMIQFCKVMIIEGSAGSNG